VNCVNCRREISDGSNFCPYCGTTQPTAGAPGAAPVPPPDASVGGVRSNPIPPAGTFSQSGIPGGNALPGASQRSTMAMVLGIASLVVTFLCCWCYGLGGLVGSGLGITAFVMGRNELEDIAGGFASPAGQSNANLGKTLGLIGAILGALAFLMMLGMIVLGAIMGATGNSSGYNY
jgi:hypothetical protein